MSGRTRLSWVTALTILSLLLGGGALNAFADGQHGNKGHGGGSGNVEHQQQNKADEVRQNVQSSDHGQAASEHGQSQAASAQQSQSDDEDTGDDVVIEVVIDVDLVTPPTRVTDEVRPGLGCGDDNHIHTGPPGNPDMECKDKHQDDDEGEVEVEV